MSKIAHMTKSAAMIHIHTSAILALITQDSEAEAGPLSSSSFWNGLIHTMQ